MALVYPSVLKMILSRILLGQEQSEDDSEEDWPDQWIRFVKSHLDVAAPPQLEDEGFESVSQWIEQAAISFCSKNRIYDGFSRRWNSGNVS